MEWRSVADYYGIYEVSSNGDVRSVDRKIIAKNGVVKTIRGKMMKQTITKKGYLVVNLHYNGVSRVVPVHILVAEAFIENSNNYPMVNHIDGNKQNNSVSNLEWCSYSHNNIHALQHNLRRPRGVPIMQRTLDGILVDTYDSAYEAARKLSISANAIIKCANHKTKSAGGFVWQKWEEFSEDLTTIL